MNIMETYGIFILGFILGYIFSLWLNGWGKPKF